MFDIGASELLLIVVVAIVVIGPKDLPLAMRTAGRWIGKIRRVSNHFRAGLEAMVREAEMEEMEKKWQEQNKKVMEQYPTEDMSELMSGSGAPSEPEGIVAQQAAANAEARGEADTDVPPAAGQTPKTDDKEPQLPLGNSAPKP